MDARRAALAVLEGLENTPRHLEALLAQHTNGLDDPRQAGLTSRLVFTVLRQRAWLDAGLAPHLSRPLERLDPPLANLLRLGAAESHFFATPAFAVVNSWVNVAAKGPARRAKGLVNGVLRKVSAQGLDPATPADPIDALAQEHSHPRWLVERLVDLWGEPAARAWLAAQQDEPALCLRANTLKIDPIELASRLADHAERLSGHPLAPEALVLEGFHTPAPELPGAREGWWQVQDVGAQALGHLLGVEPGMKVLDLCAGAGGKTGHLAALLGGGGHLVAVEPQVGRARALAANLARLDAAPVEVVTRDARELTPALGSFDRVLVDAPCSGLGVTGRRPDIRWRREAQDPVARAGLQLELLLKGIDLAAPGGAVLYATCTLLPAENQDVVAAALDSRPGLRLDWTGARTETLSAGHTGQGFWQSYPQPLGADGFFAARLVKGAQP